MKALPLCRHSLTFSNFVPLTESISSQGCNYVVVTCSQSVTKMMVKALSDTTEQVALFFQTSAQPCLTHGGVFLQECGVLSLKSCCLKGF